MSKRGALVGLVVASGLLLAGPWGAGGAHAKTFRYATQGDLRSMDPMALQETFSLATQGAVYEGLVRTNEKLTFEPALAASWERTSPTVWRFKLRPEVKFHDGSSFTADDVVFSFARVASEGSDLKSTTAAVKQVVKVDDLTVDVVTKEPDPILINEIVFLYMMSKAWCEKNGAVNPVDIRKGQENFATRNANGTGPFILKSREADVRTIFVVNPNWWDKPRHNLDEIIYTPIANDSTRVAALLSGEVDMIEPVPSQDIDRVNSTPHRKVLQAPELRTVFLGMNQTRDELTDSDVKGKNPFKDLRVRQAFMRAIDVDLIKRQVMRGASRPSALMVGPGINGYDPAIDVRPKYDLALAKQLLAEAGYPNGFSVGLDCPNDRYVNDERICQAVTAMLARIGVKVNLNAQTKSLYFPKILKRDTNFYMLGWTPSTYDAHNALVSLMVTPNGPEGTFNLGGYSNRRVDELTHLIQVEPDKIKRQAMIDEAFTIHRDEVGHIPLHQQALAWGIQDNVDLVQLADDVLKLQWINIR
jgi:peptide/nickel transport system substrate-binding protein